MLWWCDSQGQHWVFLVPDHSVPTLLEEVSWALPTKWSYQTSADPLRLQEHKSLLPTSRTSADVITESTSPSSCSHSVESTSNLCCDTWSTAWDIAVRFGFPGESRRVGIWEAGTVKWLDGVETLVKKGRGVIQGWNKRTDEIEGGYDARTCGWRGRKLKKIFGQPQLPGGSS